MLVAATVLVKVSLKVTKAVGRALPLAFPCSRYAIVAGHDHSKAQHHDWVLWWMCAAELLEQLALHSCGTIFIEESACLATSNSAVVIRQEVVSWSSTMHTTKISAPVFISAITSGLP